MASYRTGNIAFTTASGTKSVVLTPANGDLAVIISASSGSTTTPGISDTNTNGASGNYSLIRTVLGNTSADSLWVHVRNSLFGNTTSTTFTYTPGTTTGGGLAVLMISGMARMGANAVRSSGASANQAGGATPNVSFSAPALTTNLVIGAVLNGASPAQQTAPPGWVERFDQGYGTPSIGLQVCTDDSGETLTSIRWGASSGTAYCATVVELDNSIPDMPPITLMPRMGA